MSRQERTLVGYDARYRAGLRGTVCAVYILAILFLFIITFFPILHILFFQQPILLTGIDAIFKSISFQKEKINLLAPARSERYASRAEVLVMLSTTLGLRATELAGGQARVMALGSCFIGCVIPLPLGILV